MRRQLAALLSSVLLLNAPAVEVPQEVFAPEWRLENVAGSTISFTAEDRLRPAVLLFWTSWCPYCRELMPFLDRIQREYAARGVSVYALNIWEDSDPLAYFSERQYAMPLLLAADLVAEDYGVKSTPAVLVVDESLRVHYVREKGDSAADVDSAVRVTLNRLLDASLPGSP